MRWRKAGRARDGWTIALDHFRDSLAFYGDALGVKIFRKHLGWYVEQAPALTPMPSAPRARRCAA